MKTEEQKTFSLTELTPEEINTIVAHLEQGQFRVVLPLIQKIEMQLKGQVPTNGEVKQEK